MMPQRRPSFDGAELAVAAGTSRPRGGSRRSLDAPPDFPIGGRTLRDVLADGVSLSPAPDMLFQLYSYVTGGTRRQRAKSLAAGDDVQRIDRPLSS